MLTLGMRQETGARDVAQRIRVYSALTDLSLVPNTHVRHFTTACNSSYRGIRHSIRASVGAYTYTHT